MLCWGFPYKILQVVLVGKKQPAKEETQAMWVSSLRQEDPREEEMTTHSSVLAWRVPWTDEPGRLHGVAKESDAIEYSCVLTHTHTHVGGLSNREIFSHGLEAGCPQSRCQQGWVSLRPLSSSRRQPSSPCVLTGPSLCSGVRVLISSSLKDTILVGQSPP